MKKIINNPVRLVDEMLDGLLEAHPGWVRRLDGEPRALVRVGAERRKKVGIATGGGSGHLPLFIGYVGEGLADGVSVGNVFSSPSARQMLALTRALDTGMGVLHLYGNYQGDSMHFESAAERAEGHGIRVRTVRACDDVASAPPERWSDRRGVAGIFFAYKLAGARASEGADLDDVAAAAEDAIFNTRSMGVALSSCILPEVGHPNFSIGDKEMEIGMGIHGEPGVRRGPLESAESIAKQLVAAVLEDLPFRQGDQVAVLVNGLGATPPEELYVLYRSVAQILKEHSIAVHRCFVGEYATSLEMAGCSLSLMRLNEERIRLLDAPALSPMLNLR